MSNIFKFRWYLLFILFLFSGLILEFSIQKYDFQKYFTKFTTLNKELYTFNVFYHVDSKKFKNIGNLSLKVIIFKILNSSEIIADGLRKKVTEDFKHNRLEFTYDEYDNINDDFFALINDEGFDRTLYIRFKVYGTTEKKDEAIKFGKRVYSYFENDHAEDLNNKINYYYDNKAKNMERTNIGEYKKLHYFLSQPRNKGAYDEILLNFDNNTNLEMYSKFLSELSLEELDFLSEKVRVNISINNLSADRTSLKKDSKYSDHIQFELGDFLVMDYIKTAQKTFPLITIFFIFIYLVLFFSIRALNRVNVKGQ